MSFVHEQDCYSCYFESRELDGRVLFEANRVGKLIFGDMKTVVSWTLCNFKILVGCIT